ncbi:MAG: hypothetical protein IBX44_02470 [Sulfurospirillum sp.]|nr:hypothetical protein [Sulfurospirillum sp.]
MRFFKSSESVSLYNLDEEECDIHTLEDGSDGFLVTATDEKIATWLEANENRAVECEGGEFLTSVQMVFMKDKLLNFIRTKTNKDIEGLYPLYKQNNINNLQGYTQVDKDEMWAYINNHRDICSAFEMRINEAVTLKEFKTIEEEM